SWGKALDRWPSQMSCVSRSAKPLITVAVYTRRVHTTTPADTFWLQRNHCGYRAHLPGPTSDLRLRTSVYTEACFFLRPPMQFLNTVTDPPERIAAALTQANSLDLPDVEAAARAILADVRARGDAAVRE